MEINSDVFSYAASVAVRTLALAAAGWIAMAVCRVKSPAARHAVWTVVVAGMLSLAAATALLPPLPMRVLRATEAARLSPRVASAVTDTPSSHRFPLPHSRHFPWNTVAAAIYGVGLLAFAARLVCGYRLTRRLVRASRAVERFGAEEILESDFLHVPITVGWLRPKILLPVEWDVWEPTTLEAVLVHERTHVRRADWAIALMAGVNRCVFWFHPLAWWLERQLSTLAEHACDDASLTQVASRECYAETLLAMAAAVRQGDGRVAWEAMAMAKAAEVRVRVERILDEGRRIWPGLTRARWFAMAACAVPLVYLTAVVRPARVRAQTVRSQTLGAQMVDAPPVVAVPQVAAQLPDANPKARPQLQEIMAAQAEAKRALKRLEEQKLELELQLQNIQSKLADYNAMPERQLEAESQVRPWTDATSHNAHRIAVLQSEIEKMLEQLTPKHPQVKRAEAMLASLETQLLQVEREARAEQFVRTPPIAGASGGLTSPSQGFTVSAPVVIFQREPEYTEEARKARKQGSVELSVTIDANGAVRDAKVTRSLDPGLDEKAIECVKLWRFRPLTRNGERVTAVTSVEVKFRLLD